jgi:hypothetical protein
VDIELLRYTPEQWYACSAEAHYTVFQRIRPPWVERISFALVATYRDEVIGYVTARETDAESVYWQFGGSMDRSNAVRTVRGFQAILSDTRNRYKRVTTYVKNDNCGYMNLLMKHGFRAIGMRVFKEEIFLEFYQEFKGEENGVSNLGSDGNSGGS